jgi:hypothetical protein
MKIDTEARDQLINWLVNLELNTKSHLERLLSGKAMSAPPRIFTSTTESRQEYEYWGQQICDRYATASSVIDSCFRNLLNLIIRLPQSGFGSNQYDQILMQFNYELNRMFEERESLESAVFSIINLVGELNTVHPPQGLDGKRDILVRAWAQYILGNCANMRSLAALLRGDIRSCGEAMQDAETNMQEAAKLMKTATSAPGCLLAIFAVFFRV